MENDELTIAELRQLVAAEIQRLSDEDCRHLLSEINVAENRAS